MDQIIKIADFILKSFIHIWPYLLVTIPLAVIVNLTGAAKFINKAFGKNPLLSVLLATAVGAFSPFCSCGVIPVISSLLIGGVPLAPVMSFWIASPSMDPEIFFLSSSVLGWDLAVWRLAATFVISLSAGYITYFATVKGFIGSQVLKIDSPVNKQKTKISFINSIKNLFVKKEAKNVQLIAVEGLSGKHICCSITPDLSFEGNSTTLTAKENSCDCKNQDDIETVSLRKKIISEILKATIMVTKFMGIAFLINALIKFYLPQEVISGILTGGGTKQVILATLTGIPLYTSNITALPMVGGLLDLGLNKGAALAFLIGGSTTTLPAMVAVWGIAKKRVFLLYLAYAIFGALLTGLIFNLVAG
jgi:uncharacterized protein